MKTKTILILAVLLVLGWAIYSRFDYETLPEKGKEIQMIDEIVAGCTRVGLTALKNDISSVLCCPDGISLNHVEADMMIDSIIRNDGILIYDASCECLQ